MQTNNITLLYDAGISEKDELWINQPLFENLFEKGFIIGVKDIK